MGGCSGYKASVTVGGALQAALWDGQRENNDNAMSAALTGLMFRRAEQMLHVCLSSCLSCFVKEHSAGQ